MSTPGCAHCQNCEAPLSGEFCSSCGQRDIPSRVAIGELIREVLSETFEVDGRVPRTLVPFLFRPGLLTREYIAGRRARYTTPFRLFLIATLLWLASSFVVEQFTDFESKDAVIVFKQPEGGTEGGAEGVSDWLAEHFTAFGSLPEAEQAKRLANAGRESLPQAGLIMIPIFALLMKLLFIRHDRYYVEHLVFALHVHAFGFVIMAVVAPLAGTGAGALGMLGVVLYLYAALWKAYEVRWWTAALRLSVIVIVHGALLTISTFLLTVASALL